MDAVEYDVYISHRGQPQLAGAVSAGLAARGFHVFPIDADVAGGEDGLCRTLEDIPDFVLLLTDGCLAGLPSGQDRFHVEVREAIRTERNIVPVEVRGYTPPQPFPAEFARLRQIPPVAYSLATATESVARIAHRLSSHASVDERQVMHGWRRIGQAVGLFVIALLVIVAASTVPGLVTRYRASRPLPPMVLSWSAFGQRDDHGAWSETRVEDGRPLQPDDQVRVAFTTSADGYAYVLARDVRGEITVLFPGRMLKGGSRVEAGTLYTVPAGGGWWPPDDGAPLDRLYVVASYDPIENFESLADEREELAAAARAALVDSTIDGLIDGEHQSGGASVRTRLGRLIGPTLDVRPLLRTASTRLANGTEVTHPLTEARGMLSATAEISLGPK